MRTELKFAIAIVMLFVAGALTLTYAQSIEGRVAPGNEKNATPADRPPPRDGHGPSGDVYERLGLTDLQKEQIGAIRFASREASYENESKMRAADEQLRMMIDGGSFTVQKAAPLVRAKSDAMAAIELNRLAADAQIQNLLTTEQKTQLSQTWERRPPGPPGGGFGPPRR
jgi:Spy/CpxP family protein refolding chaperone